MGVMVHQCLLVFLFCLVCSGTSFRISPGDERLSSSPDLLLYVKIRALSHIRISDDNYGLLREICRKDREVNLYISMRNIESISKLNVLATNWVQREVSILTRCANINSVIIDSEILKETHLPLLLPAVIAIDSALATLQLDPSVGLSVSFSFPFIEDCFRKPQEPSIQNFRDVLAQVIEFLHRPKFYLMIENPCQREIAIDDCLANLMAQVTSVLPDHDIPLQINLRRSPSSHSISFFIHKTFVEEFKWKEVNHEEELFPSSRRELQDDDLDSFNGFAQSDADTSGTVPVINPTTPAGSTPVVNPVAPPTPPTMMTPIMTPTPATGTPTSSGQTWCVANPSASPTSLQVALDYACGYGGADCSVIQKGGSCFNPDTVHDHASYAFNDYYQKNPIPTSCNFGGTAMLTNTDPSTPTCQYPSSSSSSSVINTTNPTGSTVTGSEPPGYYNSASPFMSWAVVITLACLPGSLMA